MNGQDPDGVGASKSGFTWPEEHWVQQAMVIRQELASALESGVDTGRLPNVKASDLTVVWKEGCVGSEDRAGGVGGEAQSPPVTTEGDVALGEEYTAMSLELQ